MVVYVYKCGNRFEYVYRENDCKSIKCGCGKRHKLRPTEFQRPPGYSTPQPDELEPYNFDWAAGRSFSTRTERKQFYRDNDLNRISKGELRRKNAL